MAVEPHKHCPICGTPIPLNELVCSPDCQKVWDARLNQRKRSQIILYVIDNLGNNAVIMQRFLVKAQFSSAL